MPLLCPGPSVVVADPSQTARVLRIPVMRPMRRHNDVCVEVDRQRLRGEDAFVTENGCDEDGRKAWRAVTRARGRHFRRSMAVVHDGFVFSAWIGETGMTGSSR